jgi:putative PEP-CTERM system histidine kinase
MPLTTLIGFAAAVLAAALAVMVIWQERRSTPHWSLSAGLLVLGVESVLLGLSADALLPQEVLRWQSWRSLATALLPATWLLFALSYARGNYREFLRKWRSILGITLVLPLIVGVIFREHLFISIARQNANDSWVLGLGWAGLVLHVAVLLSVVLVLMNLERTYRAAVGTMQWRIKYMVVGLAVLFVARAYTSSQALLFRATALSLQPLDSVALLTAGVLLVRSLFRPGHFEVSVYPSHSVLYKSITVMLAGTYLVLVGLLANLASWAGGDGFFTIKAFLILVALVFLTLVLLSDRFRVHTKRFVSRHFQRPLYDYRRVWKTFTEGTARRVEQGELCGAISKLISEIFQALSVTVWLVDERREKLVFTASTSLSEAKAGYLKLEAPDCQEVVSRFSKVPEPVDIDSSKEAWASALRRLHPDEFRQGHRTCVPMIGGGELLGLIMVGDRVGGLPLSAQDLDLLKSVSDQAGAGILNIQLSQRLAQAKQLEAFQAMSAFFVHDLKNTASTLSLMLQNLPIHFNDPQFREDALRGISKTVDHINGLISRLSVLRRGLTVEPVLTDINEIVKEAARCLESGPGVELTKNLGALPPVPIDPSQMQNVITNLLLNARDAVEAGGRIQVETQQRNGSVVLSVADNGCGMSPEFVRGSLFRPFQTTKKKGIGIGMFQCKMIVEAHRGRIEVDSEPGKGTTFRVVLPVHEAASPASQPSAGSNLDS